MWCMFDSVCVKQLVIFFGVVVILLLNVMELGSVECGWRCFCTSHWCSTILPSYPPVNITVHGNATTKSTD